MAYTYTDPMSYYTGDYTLGGSMETEEERRRREREEAERAMPVKQTITTDPTTGAQTVKIEGSAYNLSSANPLTPTVAGPVAPDQSDAETERLRRQAATAQGVPQAPAAPGGITLGPGYNQRIGMLESGNRPDMGYHAPGVSTAYGQYGLTQRAYEDARRVNPALPTDIRQATPEQQTQAQTAYTQQNARYLQNYGVEPTENNLAAAHFLGAKGLADYLKTGQISPMAAAANGGYERTKAIVDQRLAGGGAMPTPGPGVQVAGVGAAGMPQTTWRHPSELGQPVVPEPQIGRNPLYALTPETGGPGLRVPGQEPGAPKASADAVKLYHSIQDRPQDLMAYAQDETNPQWLRERAQNRVMEQMNQDTARRDAQAKFNQMVAEGDTKGISNAMQGRVKGEEGSYLKMIALSFISPQLAGAEAIKLGLAPSRYVTSSYTDAAGNEVAVELQQRADGKIMGGMKFDGTPLTEQELNQVASGVAGGKFKPEISGTAYVKKDAEGNVIARGVRTTEVRGNRTITKIESGGKTYDINQGWEPESISTATAKAIQQKQVNLAYDPIIRAATSGAEALGKFNAMNGTNFQIAGTGTGGAPIVVDGNTNQIVRPGAGGVVTATQGGAAAGAAPGGMTPTQMETQTEVGKVARKQFVEKTVPTIIEEGSNGSQVASIRRQQISLINSNPSILGIYNGTGTGYDRARNVISKVVTGAYGNDNSQEFYNDLKNVTGITQAERAALEDFANMNMTINSKTLKANTGGGQISNAEQKINKDANLGNIAQQTALASLQGLYRSQFASELASAKSNFANSRPDLNTDQKFAAAWSKEQAKLTKAYEGIMEARAEFLKPFRPKEGASAAELNAFNDKVFKAFEMYPAPTYNSDTGRWSYGTANAEKAAARKLLGQ